MIIGFWKPKDQFGSFSNWAHAEFYMNGRHFKNSEQAFMYLKAELFGDTAIMEQILANPNPMMDRIYGRKVKAFDAAVFDAKKYQMMVDVCYEKFTQNTELKELLLSTGDAILAEASPKDKIWGVGLRVDDPDFTDPGKWRGTNLLGQALMEVRNRIRLGGL